MIYEKTWGAWAPTAMRGIHVTGQQAGHSRHGTHRTGPGKKGGRLRHGDALPQTVRDWPPEREENARFHDRLESLLGVSDILSIHCPSTAETLHILNEQSIARLPDGAIVVNTARGNVIDDDALIAALSSGKLFAAGLDVFDGETGHPSRLPRTRQCFPSATPG